MTSWAGSFTTIEADRPENRVQARSAGSGAAGVFSKNGEVILFQLNRKLTSITDWLTFQR